MSFGAAALLLIQESTNIYQQPSFFAPTFIAIWIIGLVICLGATVVGFKSSDKTAHWFKLAGLFLLIYFLQWFVFVFAIAKQSMSLIWGLLVFYHLPLILAAACILIGLMKLNAASDETKREEI